MEQKWDFENENTKNSVFFNEDMIKILNNIFIYLDFLNEAIYYGKFT